MVMPFTYTNNSLGAEVTTAADPNLDATACKMAKGIAVGTSLISAGITYVLVYYISKFIAGKVK